MKEIIGNNIKYIREKLGFTQKNLADLLKVEQPAISQYEKGERSVSMDKLEKLADFFGVDAYDFYEEDQGNISIKLVFAFRKSEELDEIAINAIREFSKVVKNYMNLTSKLSDNAKI